MQIEKSVYKIITTKNFLRHQIKILISPPDSGNKNYLLNHTMRKGCYLNYHHLHLTGFDYHSLIKTLEDKCSWHKCGRIIDVSFKNRAGKKFTTTPKFGETIIVEILIKNVIGKHYNLRVWEDDTIGEHDLLYEGIHKITNDKQLVTFALTKDRQQIGEIGNDPKDPDSGEYRAESGQTIRNYSQRLLLQIFRKSLQD